MSRWEPNEAEALVEIRRKCREEIESVPPFPDLVGDRRIIRFLRGSSGKVDLASEMYGRFLRWYKENNVAVIRNRILYEGCNHPFNFPNGELIISIAPQIVIAPNARDNVGQPVTMESFGFDPNLVHKHITLEEYLVYLIYTLEYRALVLEQISHEYEQNFLREFPNPDFDGYGIIVKTCTIRDLKGLGFQHMGSKAKAFIKSSLDIAIPNYQEYLGKSHMINVPWIFNTLWIFVRGLLDPSILAKISICGTDYLPTLLRDMPIESIPACLGGNLQAYNESFHFDLSPSGPFYYPSQDTASSPESADKSCPVTKEVVASPPTDVARHGSMSNFSSVTEDVEIIEVGSPFQRFSKACKSPLSVFRKRSQSTLSYSTSPRVERVDSTTTSSTVTVTTVATTQSQISPRLQRMHLHEDLTPIMPKKPLNSYSSDDLRCLQHESLSHFRSTESAKNKDSIAIKSQSSECFETRTTAEHENSPTMQTVEAVVRRHSGRTVQPSIPLAESQQQSLRGYVIACTLIILFAVCSWSNGVAFYLAYAIILPTIIALVCTQLQVF